jgi:choline dehydrogenase-like flavoprotein
MRFIGYSFQNSLGVGHAVRTVHNGVRTTSADFVHNFNKRNLTIRTRVYVNRIIVEKNKDDCEYKAIGVEVHDDASGESMIIKARKEIILSAG